MPMRLTEPQKQTSYLLLPLYIVFLRTRMPACVVETS